MPDTFTLVLLLWVVVTASWVVAYHELRDPGPPDLAPPEQPLDFTHRRRF